MKAVAILMTLAMLGIGAARAEISVYDSCTDAAGRTIPAQMDFTLGKVVASGVDAGAPVIRYNPQRLPRLSPSARLFFFAQECARFAIHAGLGNELKPAVAHEADCLGVAMLTKMGALADPTGVQALQAELTFSQAEWDQLPSPQRTFDFSNCAKHTELKLPPSDLPPAQQLDWNACVRICADRLRSCQKACRGNACDDRCLSTYDGCEKACGPQ